MSIVDKNSVNAPHSRLSAEVPMSGTKAGSPTITVGTGPTKPRENFATALTLTLTLFMPAVALLSVELWLIKAEKPCKRSSLSLCFYARRRPPYSRILAGEVGVGRLELIPPEAGSRT
jgi:hypothetical protein